MNKIDIIQKIIEENHLSVYAWYLLGKEQMEQGLTSEALKSFSEALKYSDDILKKEILKELSNLSSINNKEETDNKEETEVLQDNSVIPFKVVQGELKNKENNNDTSRERKINFSDVGGLEALKETIRMKIIKPFVSPSIFQKFNKKAGGGILLYGPPGCGKTFMARATAGECNARFENVSITDILDPYIGVSERNVRDIFEKAKLRKPCVLFFDEIDALGFNRTKINSEYLRPVIDQLLYEMDGINSNTDKLLLIGATNMPWDVDNAFKRPGRFDKTVFVSPPDERAREIILQLKMRNRPAEAIDYKTIAERTEFYSGADIENLVESAIEIVINEIIKTGVERNIKTEDLLIALETTRPSTIEWFRTIRNYVKYANDSGFYDDVEKFLNRNKKSVL